MKTKVRISRGRTGNYDHLTMQILQQDKFSNYLKPIGHITWQGDDRYGWYAMRFNVEAELSEHNHLLAMYKLACYVKERTTSENPMEVMLVMGGEEHVYEYGMYIPISDNGKIVFDVRRSRDAGVYIRVIAANEVVAERIVNGMIRRKDVGLSEYVLTAASSRLAHVATELAYATSPKINANS